MKLAAFRSVIRWKCEDCGAGQTQPSDEQQAVWKARGQCGGPFKEGSRAVKLGKDAQGLYVAATTIATDATAPCFTHDEKFRSCPIAMAGSRFVHAAYTWHGSSEKGLLPTLGPVARMAGHAVAAIKAVESAQIARKNWEHEKWQKQNEARTRSKGKTR